MRLVCMGRVCHVPSLLCVELTRYHVAWCRDRGSNRVGMGWCVLGVLL